MGAVTMTEITEDTTVVRADDSRAEAQVAGTTPMPNRM